MKKFVIAALAASTALFFSFEANARSFDRFDLQFPDPPQLTFPDKPEFDFGDPGEKLQKLLCILECIKEFEPDLPLIDWRNIDWENINWDDLDQRLPDDIGERFREHLANCDCCGDPRDVPDGGATVSLLGLGLCAVAGLRKRLARK